MLVSSLKLSGGHNVCPVWSCSSIKPSKCPRGTGIGAHDEPESLPTMVPESVPTMLRNKCPRCAGIRITHLHRVPVGQRAWHSADDDTRRVQSNCPPQKHWHVTDGSLPEFTSGRLMLASVSLVRRSLSSEVNCSFAPSISDISFSSFFASVFIFSIVSREILI